MEHAPEDGVEGGAGADLGLSRGCSAPLPLSDLIPRRGLVEKLARCLQHRLTVISAPVGSGKTSLLSEWAAAARGVHAIVCLALDPGDGEFVPFFRRLGRALHAEAPAVSAGPEGPVRERRRRGPPALASSLLQDLSRAPGELAVVIDNCHLIRSAAVHEVLWSMLERLPPHAHLVLSGRSCPPLPLSRLRARGELLELRASDLRFTVEESTALLGRRAERLAPGQAEALAARAEGWAAGLQLAAAVAREKVDPRTLVDRFTGNHRLLLDFFGDEVLRREPPEVQEFLLRTSILERMCGPLCEALSGGGRSAARRRAKGPPGDGSHGRRMLERLERENLFLVPLDDERRFWRYHRLFSEFLRRELEETRPGELRALHRRAGRWLERNGYGAEAAGHAVAVGNFERAAHLIQTAWRTSSAPSTVLLPKIRALPPELLQSRPELSLVEVSALLATGRTEDALERLGEPALAGTRDPLLLAEADALRGFASALCGKPQRTLDLLARGERPLARAPAAMRALLHVSLGLAHESLGDERRARAHYGRTRVSSEGQAAGVSPMLAMCRLGNMEVNRGALAEAARLFEAAVRLGSEVAWPRAGYPGLGLPQFGLGRVSYQWNDLGSAARCFGAAVELGSASPLVDVPVISYLLLAQVRQAQGDVAAARRLSARAQELMDRAGVPTLVVAIRALQARLWLRQGDLDRASRWAESHGRAVVGVPEQQHVANTTWARVMLATRRARATIAPAWRWLRAARTAGLAGLALEVEILLALGLAGAGEVRAARARFDEALKHARPERWSRLFLDEGEPMLRLLVHAARGRSATAAYARELLSGFDGRGASAPAAPGWGSPGPEARPQASLVEPLARREGEVLSLIAEGLSNAEIAARLVIRVATVKTHINNLYGKLGARSRTDAVARARRLALI